VSNAVILVPADEVEAAAIVAEASATGRPLSIVGGGTRARLGRPVDAGTSVSTARLDRIIFHEPAEMVIRAQAGAPLRAIEEALARHGQMLPFEPMDHRLLFGSEGEPTIGALAAANISGPRRIAAGAARDALIGLRFVNGRGEIINSGGRVMKNVTGLDLVKLLGGAYGTLGLILEATFRVLPRPERSATVVIRRLDDARAIEALSAALGSPYGASGAAHLSAGMGRDFPRTFARIEGFADSVEARVEKLIALLAPYGARHALYGEDSERVWTAVRDVHYLAEPRDRAVWRVSLAPSKAAAFVAALGAGALGHYYDWGGGLVWLATAQDREAATAIRAALKPLGGHATLVRASEAMRRAVDVFQPLSPAAMALTRGIKASLDPAGVLNPGRMYEGV
jgi:glycolate oxidase FAD binding subunit